MAEQESKIILNVDTGESVKNVAELQAVIAGYKEQLKDTNATAEENAKTAGDLAKAQGVLRDVMNSTTLSTEEATKAVDLNNKSYNDMVHTMADLTKAWRATTNETDRADIGKNIKAINDKLKELDETRGNFQRNVGNYKSALEGLEKGLLSMGSGAQAVINPIKGVTAGFKTLSATPVVAILGLLANLIVKVAGALKTSEENTKAMTAAMTSFSAVGDVVKNVLQKLGEVLTSIVGKFNELLYKIFPKLQDAANKRIEATQKELDLLQQQRDTNEQNAFAELEIAKLKQKAADKATYTAKERIAFLKQAGDLELEIFKRNKDVADKEYELLLAQKEFAGNSKEENDKLSQALVRKTQAETAYFTKTKELTAQISEATKAAAAEETAAVKAKQEAEYKLIESNKKTWEERLKHARQGGAEEYEIKLQIAEDEYQLERKKTENAVMDASEKVALLIDIDKRYKDRLVAIAEEYADTQEATEKQRMANEIARMRDGSMEKLQAEVELRKYELDTLHQAETESDEAFKARMIEAEKNYTASKRALAQQQVSNIMSVASSTSSLLSSIADMYEANGENDEKAQERAKNLRIASSTIDTITGAIKAYMSAQDLPSPFNFIVGAANAATVTATGLANIAKIKNTDVSGTTASATAGTTISASQSAPTISTAQQVADTSAAQVLNQIASGQRSQRVYILQSDIEASNKASKVQVQESTFA